MADGCSGCDEDGDHKPVSGAVDCYYPSGGNECRKKDGTNHCQVAQKGEDEPCKVECDDCKEKCGAVCDPKEMSFLQAMHGDDGPSAACMQCIDDHKDKCGDCLECHKGKGAGDEKDDKDDNDGSGKGEGPSGSGEGEGEPCQGFCDDCKPKCGAVCDPKAMSFLQAMHGDDGPPAACMQCIDDHKIECGDCFECHKAIHAANHDGDEKDNHDGGDEKDNHDGGDEKDNHDGHHGYGAHP